MSSSKAAVKAIGDSVKQQKWDDAIQKATEFLEREPKHYQAYVSSLLDQHFSLQAC